MGAESYQQAQEWADAVAMQVLDWTWQAFDSLRSSVLSRIDFRQPLDQLERDLTAHHFREIQRVWAQQTEGYSALSPHHEWPEMASRSPAPAKPPAYDIAFVWSDNPRVAWTIEAKVVPTTGTLAQYLGDTAKFASGTAAPLVTEGAQVAYLLSGVADVFFSNLSTALSLRLDSVTEFVNRPHRSSMHMRASAPDLRLHHMAMLCSNERSESCAAFQ